MSIKITGVMCAFVGLTFEAIETNEASGYDRVLYQAGEAGPRFWVTHQKSGKSVPIAQKRTDLVRDFSAILGTELKWTEKDGFCKKDGTPVTWDSSRARFVVAISNEPEVKEESKQVDSD